MNNDNQPHGPGDGGEPGGPNPWMKSMMVWGGIFLALLLVVSMFSNAGQQPTTEIAYSDFREKVAEGSVKEVQISEDKITGKLDNDSLFSTTPVPNDTSLPKLLEDNEVEFTGAPAEEGNMLLFILIQTLPFLLILGIAFFALRQKHAAHSVALCG